MTTLTSQFRTAPNRSVPAADTALAYRLVGRGSGVPVVMLNHWGANLDDFDPRIIDGLATDRPVFALDYRGIGLSGGKPPLNVSAMAHDMIVAIRALGLSQVDLVGFSLGGFVTQQIMLDAPDLVRRAVLAGTGPAGGRGIARVGKVSWPLILKGMVTFRDPKTFLFFTSTPNGQAAARAFLARLRERSVERDKAVGLGALLRQLKAIRAWGRQQPQALETIRPPVLVVNGDHDIMVPSENSSDMAQRMPGARLVLFPDAGHGGIFQYHERFVAETRAFLDSPSENIA